MSHPVLLIARRHWRMLVLLPLGSVVVALVVLAYQPVRWEARAVLLAPAPADREAIEIRAGSGRLARLLGLAATESAAARINRSARVEIVASAPEPRRAVAVANAVARALLPGPWPGNAPPLPAPTLEDEAVAPQRVGARAALVVWAALAAGVVAAMGLGGAVELVRAGGLEGRVVWTQ